MQCFTSPPTQYRLYGRRFLQVKRPNQQYQSTDSGMEWNGYRTSQTVTPLQNYTKQRIELSLTVNNDNAYKGQNRVQWVKKAATVWFISMT